LGIGHDIAKRYTGQSFSKDDSSQCLELLWQAHQELMREVFILHLLTQTFEIIDNNLEPIEHLWNGLIILHLKVGQLVLEHV
jgi:hypothetical protein